MPFARALLWAQWRTLRNRAPHGGVAWSSILGLIWYGLWAIGALVLVRVFSEAGSAAMIRDVLPSGLLLVFLYWQLIPILMLSPGASLEWKKLRAYPISESQLFFVEVLLRFTSGVEMVLLLTGISIGMLLNPSVPARGILWCAVFVIFNLVVAVGLRDVLSRVLAHRRIREVAFLIFALIAAIPQFLLTRQGSPGLRFPQLRGAEPSWGWPWTATANLMQGIEVPQSSGILLFWLVAATGFSWWQFKRTLHFDAEAAGSSTRRGNWRAAVFERCCRIPSVLFRDPVAALMEKEFRFLLRTPRFRIVFLMGFTFGLLIWLPISFGYGGSNVGSATGGITSFLFRHYLAVVSGYSIMLLGEVCFWNSFGFDRSGAQFYFLAPVPFPRVLAAKNMVAAFFIVLEITVISCVCAMLGLPLGSQRLSEAFLAAGVVCLYLASAGNMQSVRAARGVNPGISFQKGRVQTMLFLLYPVVFAPVGLAYLARYTLDSTAAFYGALAVTAALGMILYGFTLRSASALAERQKEKIIAALSASQGPVAT